jgi:pyruvate formate lyase activating enzyme
MLISGIQTLTLLDYPEKVAAIIFTAGCNMRCGFCHNPQFVDPEQIKKLQKNFIPEDKFFKFLKSRENLLDGIVISGGEPTLQPDLITFIQKIKQHNFLVKLDTNGTNPAVIASLLTQNLVDYIAMDIKSAPQNFAKISNPVDLKLSNTIQQKITKSRDLIMNSTINYEFRTTVIKELHDLDEIDKIKEFCHGAKKYILQNFRPAKTLDPAFNKFHGFSDTEFLRLKNHAEF